MILSQCYYKSSKNQVELYELWKFGQNFKIFSDFFIGKFDRRELNCPLVDGITVSWWCS